MYWHQDNALNGPSSSGLSAEWSMDELHLPFANLIVEIFLYIFADGLLKC